MAGLIDAFKIMYAYIKRCLSSSFSFFHTIRNFRFFDKNTTYARTTLSSFVLSVLYPLSLYSNLCSFERKGVNYGFQELDGSARRGCIDG